MMSKLKVPREIRASVTERGQVTIPAEVRKALGLTPRGKVTFVIEGDKVSLKRPTYTIETAYGSVPPLGIDIDEAIRLAKDERAEALIEKMRKGLA